MNKDAMREAFEAWINTEWNMQSSDLKWYSDLNLYPDNPVCYEDEEVQDAWEVWQAALSQQQTGVDELVKALEGIIEFLAFRSCPDETEKEVNEKYRLLDAAHQALASHRTRKGE